jgi:tetratricopeptide (TPR) repeat protein
LTPRNPYIAGNPVGNSTAFVGREDVLRDVLKVLHDPMQSAITLYGQRRIGKTSMLQYLLARLPQEGDFRSVYFDLQDKASWPLPSLLQVLARAIAENMKTTNPALPQEQTAPFRAWLLNILNALPPEASLVLLFDEFDVLADPEIGSVATKFFLYLRDLLALDPLRLKIVFVLGRNITELSSSALSIFKSVPSKRMSLLSHADTLQLVRLSEANGTLSWPEKAAEEIWTLTHGHPFLTQALCAQVWETFYDESPESVPKATPDMVGEALEYTLESTRNVLEWLWGGLGPAEKIISSALARAGQIVVDETRLEQILRDSGVKILIRELQNASELLKDWDILEEADGGYIFRVEMLRRWIVKYHSLSRTRDELNRVQPAADALFQDAVAFYGQGDLVHAENLLEQAIGINPNHQRANELVAEILIDGGRLDEARDKLEKLMEFSPQTARQRLIQVYLHYAQIAMDNKARLMFFEKVLVLDPSHPEAYARVEEIKKLEQEEKELAFNFIEGRQALQRGEWPIAIELLQKVVQIRPAYTYGDYADTAADLLAQTLRESKKRHQKWNNWLRRLFP